MQKSDREISTAPMPVFPTQDSLLAVVREAEARAPIAAEDIYPLLATYHNTLLHLLELQRNEPTEEVLHHH